MKNYNRIGTSQVTVEVHGVSAITLGNRLDKPSSNPGQSCLYFLLC